MSIASILNLCARITGHAEQYRLLAKTVQDGVDWPEVLRQAERQGMGPLLHLHLTAAGCLLPGDIQRSLKVLVRIHGHQARVRQRLLQELLIRLTTEGLSPLVIKGAALGHTLYPDPALRPMRDIDLLLAPDQAVRAQQVALSAGFDRHGTPTPDDHYHLPPLVKTVEGMKVCIEIHRALYPDCPPYYPQTDFERLLDGSASFACGEVCCSTLGTEEMLSHLYHHGFRMPLSYEPYKLINAADLIGFVEMHADELDWPRLRREQPQLCAALAMLQHLAPWDPERVPAGIIDPREATRRRRPLPYRGWPQRKIRQLKHDNLSIAAILKETFLPPLWWTKLYYGALSRWQTLWCYGYHHPRHILWWARLYYALPVVIAPDGGSPSGRWQRLMILIKKMVS
jgi:hypothetical protein